MVGQIHFKGGTLEERFHLYINGVRCQKFFVAILTPVHAILGYAGFPVDEVAIDHVKRATEPPPDPVHSPFITPAQRQAMKEAAEQRREIFRQIEENP